MEMMLIALVAGIAASSCFALLGDDSDSTSEDLPPEEEGANRDEGLGLTEGEDLLVDPLEEAGDQVSSDDPAQPSSVEGQFIIEGDANDLVEGWGGDDTISTGDGDDTVFGGDGDDLIDGRANTYRDFDGGSYGWNDFSDQGTDHVYGGVGNDTIALSDQDFGVGGEGSDLFIVYAKQNLDVKDLPEVLDFDPSSDRIRVMLEFGHSHFEEDLGEYFGGGEFEYNADVTFRPLDDGTGTLIEVDGHPTLLVRGPIQVSSSHVDVRAFLTE